MDQVQFLVHFILIPAASAGLSRGSGVLGGEGGGGGAEEVAGAGVDLDEAVVEDGDVGLKGLASLGRRGELDDGGLGIDDLEREGGEREGYADAADGSELLEVVAEREDLEGRERTRRNVAILAD